MIPDNIKQKIEEWLKNQKFLPASNEDWKEEYTAMAYDLWQKSTRFGYFIQSSIKYFEGKVVAPLLLQVKELKGQYYSLEANFNSQYHAYEKRIEQLQSKISSLELQNKELLELVNNYETVQCGGSLEILVKKFLENQQQLSPEMANVLNKTYSRLFSKTPTKL